MSKNYNPDRGHRAEINPADEAVEVNVIGTAFPVEDETESEPEQVYGVVCNCERLNVRKMPEASPETEVLCVLEKGERVLIDEAKSTDEWFGVCTESGIDGFCMKDFIRIET